MQTFLSEPTFGDSVEVLDNSRLNKQYLEGWQILNAISLTPEGGGSRVDGKIPFASNHPATNMWRGSEAVLVAYLSWVRMELNSRGIKFDLIYSKIKDTTSSMIIGSNPPDWWIDPVQKDRLKLTHRANLYRKDPQWYAHYKVDSLVLEKYNDQIVCCTTHAPYFYPTHWRDKHQA